MKSQEEPIRVVSIEDGFEEVFWKHVEQDPFHYYFYILDFKEARSQTRILLAMREKEVEGLLLIYADFIVQLRGTREAVEKLLQSVDLERVELQAPLDCDDIVNEKYAAYARHELVLMKLGKADASLHVRHEPVKLEPQDAESVTKVMQEADPEWWGDIEVQNLKDSMKQTYWLGIRGDGKIVSVGNARFVDFGSNIGVVATDQKYRNMGYATSIVSALVREILKRSDAALIHVLGDNALALRVYSTVGFKPYRRYLLVRARRK